MPTLKPVVEPALFSQIVKKFDEMAAAELERYSAMNDHSRFATAAPERAAQLKAIDNLITMLKNSTLNDKQKSRVLAGALMDIKQQIANRYGMLAMVWSPNNSYVHAQINKVIGDTSDNKFTEETKQRCHLAFVSYINSKDNLTTVMKDVEKAELITFDLSIKNPVSVQCDIPAAAAALKSLNPDSKHHVVVQEKKLDTSHMSFFNKHDRKKDRNLNKKIAEKDIPTLMKNLPGLMKGSVENKGPVAKYEDHFSLLNAKIAEKNLKYSDLPELKNHKIYDQVSPTHYFK